MELRPVFYGISRIIFEIFRISCLTRVAVSKEGIIKEIRELSQKILHLDEGIEIELAVDLFAMFYFGRKDAFFTKIKDHLFYQN